MIPTRRARRQERVNRPNEVEGAEQDVGKIEGSVSRMTNESPPETPGRELRRALSTFATGVVVITACDGDGARAGLTVNSFNSVSLDPPLVLWSQSLRSPSLPLFRRATHFVINILASDQRHISQHFARGHGDKFAGIECSGANCGAPVLAGAVAHFECRREHEYYGGDHAIFIGRVENYAYSDRAPLIFVRGGYLDLAEPGGEPLSRGAEPRP
jgi:flavin reductase (DIM6/NTAB) family NADH-FMN oxidoreductase RutF